MYFAPSISDTNLGPLVQKALVIGTPKAWKKRIEESKAEQRRNPFVAPYYAERYALEIAMDGAQKHKRATGRLPDIAAADAATHRAFAFAAMLANVYARVSPSAQNVLAGRVRDGLRGEVSLAPLAFELLIAAHLMERGADVEWHDLESGGGYDFVARQNGSEAEVECKTFSADVGRQMHRRQSYQLAGLIQAEFGGAVARLGNIFVALRGIEWVILDDFRASATGR